MGQPDTRERSAYPPLPTLMVTPRGDPPLASQLRGLVVDTEATFFTVICWPRAFTPFTWASLAEKTC